MNERIKQFAEQAGLIADGEHWFSAIQETDVRSIDLERFAELVRQDERQALAQEQTKCPRCGEVNPAEIHTCSPQVAQPEREWVGLTEDEMTEIWEKSGWYVRLFESVEAKLKEKNT